jgi:hypothetical protein
LHMILLVLLQGGGVTFQIFSCFLPHMLDNDLGVFVARSVIV